MSDVVDTACGKKCPFGTGEDCSTCPFYQEHWFKSSAGEMKLIKDCIPKRTLGMVMQMHNQIFALQQANEEQRNEFSVFTDSLMQIAQRQVQIMKKDLLE